MDTKKNNQANEYVQVIVKIKKKKKLMKSNYQNTQINDKMIMHK